jgi:hypothetical protein
LVSAAFVAVSRGDVILLIYYKSEANQQLKMENKTLLINTFKDLFSPLLFCITSFDYRCDFFIQFLHYTRDTAMFIFV